MSRAASIATGLRLALCALSGFVLLLQLLQFSRALAGLDFAALQVSALLTPALALKLLLVALNAALFAACLPRRRQPCPDPAANPVR